MCRAVRSRFACSFCMFSYVPIAVDSIRTHFNCFVVWIHANCPQLHHVNHSLSQPLTTTNANTNNGKSFVEGGSLFFLCFILSTVRLNIRYRLVWQTIPNNSDHISLFLSHSRAIFNSFSVCVCVLHLLLNKFTSLRVPSELCWLN